MGIWKKLNSAVNDIVKNLEHTDWSYSTINTMLNRLVDKGFVKSEKE